MTVLVPTRRGTSADQDDVPDATPASPAEVVNLTEAIPTLSLAVPVMRIEEEEVEMIVAAGDVTRREGAVVSPVGDAGGWAGGCAGVEGGVTGGVVGVEGGVTGVEGGVTGVEGGAGAAGGSAGGSVSRLP